MRPLARPLMLGMLAVLLAAAPGALAYPVGPPVPLAQMAEQADVILKATVLSWGPVEDPWFRPHHGYEVRGARLRVVSVVKGEAPGPEIVFLHYAPSAQMGMIPPQHYRLEGGLTYLFFAARTAKRGVLRQLWMRHTMKEDQGVLRARDARPHRGATVAEVVWNELGRLLAARDPADVVYAIDQLDEMSAIARVNSNPRYRLLEDFDREAVLAAIAPHAESPRTEVALRAIEALGSGNPYLGSRYAAHWLAAVGTGHFSGYSRWDATRRNLGGRLYADLLTEIASGDAPAKVRALAIRAQGRSGSPPDPEVLKTWLQDPEPSVRQAALVLSADHPAHVAVPLIWAGAHDDAAEARAGAARAVGYGRFEASVPILVPLLDDADARVRRAAAMSLLSFSAETERAHFEAALDHPEFGVLFVNALASDDVRPHLDALRDICRGTRKESNWWGGRMPRSVSWDLLFASVQAKPIEALRAGEADRDLDALEALEWFGSSEPRDLYALYLQRGLVERAAAFRRTCEDTFMYDIGRAFDEVDRRPGHYVRERRR